MKTTRAQFGIASSTTSETENLTEPGSGRKLLMRPLWATALVLSAFGAHAAVVLTNLHSFQVFTDGTNPEASLVQASDGSLYGTTYFGGTNGGNGTVFRITTNGALTSLYSFTGGNDGWGPRAGLVQGSDGYFYGTASGGGTNGNGTVFKISTNGTLTSLYSFTGGNDGANPQAGLGLGSDGCFYGTAYGGGANSAGTVFKISTNGTLTSLHSFTGGNDGANPQAGLVLGSDGCFYGTTYGGGRTNYSGYYNGTVFKISTNGTLTSLYSFTGGNDGANPVGGLVQGSDGGLYGTTYGGGRTNYSGFYNGTVFKISTNGVFTSLYSFTGTNDGANPLAGLVLGSDSNLYGTTYGGGTYYWYGTVFKISTNGVFTSLYDFTGGNDGGYPEAGLVQGSDGSLYGTAYGGGTYSFGNSGKGTVFKISTNGALTNLYSFTGFPDGGYPEAGLAQGSDRCFYGTAYGGGTDATGIRGNGTVFKISTNGVLTSLYAFTGGNDGGYPEAGLAQGSDGSFYGTTYSGGRVHEGTVFKITTNGALTNLYSFTGGNDGWGPRAGLAQGSDGIFYGTTYYGGRFYEGNVFKISTNGTLTNLYSFIGGNDGANPQAGLVQGSDGYFYGTTWGGGTNGNGTVFKISTNGTLTSLYSFTGGNDGANPVGGLVQGSDGGLYGTAYGGGANSAGTVFKISTNGALTSLYSFTGGNDGANPQAGLVQGSDGYFYGTTYGGGRNSAGTVFKISTNGALTSLHSFTSHHDGANPEASLVQGSDGSFYGTASNGGLGGAGTVFRLTVVAESPELTIIHSGANVILTWPTSATGYTLQSTSNLGSSAVWTTNSSGPVVVSGQFTVTNPISGTQRFFRLSQ